MGVEINEVKFEYRTDCRGLYLYNYEKLAARIGRETDEAVRRGIWREILKTDLWAIVSFVMKVPGVNHPYVLAACRDVQEGARTDTLDLWFRGGFKAVDLQERVPTIDGWKLHGDLEVGDFVFGSDGKPTRVVGRTEVFKDADCYRVTFSDGYSVVVSGDHLWEVGKRSIRRLPGERNRWHYKDYFVKSTRELSGEKHENDRRWSVRLAPPIEYGGGELPIHPYVLGAWLGDGTSEGATITGADEGIFEKIRRCGHEVVKNKAKYRWAIRGLSSKLRGLGLLKNKHIPEQYLRASTADRWELLRGLMDTDGTCGTNGKATFCQKSEVIARQVFELAGSLGLAPQINGYNSSFRGKPFRFYQVSFRAFLETPAFSLQRKVERCRSGGRVFKHKYIRSVERVESRPVSCIQVEAKDGLYIIGDKFTLTHNSTVITVAETIQDLCRDAEERICFLSYVRPAALSYLRQVKQICETSELLKWAFPDVFWSDPEKQAFRWSEDGGLYVQRKGTSKEASVEGWGLIDGMPTRMHYSKIVYDDVVTPDYVGNPEIMKKVIDRYEMSLNLLAKAGRKRVVGTTYHYEDLLTYLRKKKGPDGKLIFDVRVKTATDNGQANGKSVWHTEKFLKELQTDPLTFQSQQLLDPSPAGAARLAWQMVDEVGKLPEDLYKFMLIDGAGDKAGKDSWSIMLLGVEPFRDDLGASEVYVLDAVIRPMGLVEAVEEVISMYMKAGKVLKLGVEKVGMSTTELHIAAALRAKGKYLSEENGNLVILRTGGVEKQKRIEQQLAWPLCNGKIHLFKGLKAAVKERILEEMKKFPFWHDDALDTLAYGFQITKDYRFPVKTDTEKKEDAWFEDDDDTVGTRDEDGWLRV